MIAPVISEESAHIYKLVRQQKPSNKRLPSSFPMDSPLKFQRSYNRTSNYQPLMNIEKALNVQPRLALTNDSKRDIFELLQSHPHVRTLGLSLSIRFENTL